MVSVTVSFLQCEFSRITRLCLSLRASAVAERESDMAVDVPGELNLDEAAWGSGGNDFYEDIEQIGEETDG